MVKIQFKNVGQGDSIIVEWSTEGKDYVGIIDCNIAQGLNPTLDYLKGKQNFIFQFIILSHFHLDHFSGMADIFEYCIDKNIKVKFFYHSLAPFVGEIYNRIFTSKRVEREVERFMETYNNFDNYVEYDVPVSEHTSYLKLTDKINLSFLPPAGGTYNKMQIQIARKVNKIATTAADINKLATIIKIENETQGLILTSDAVKKSFVRLRNRINSEIVLVQVPHHGSIRNIYEAFWEGLKKVENCPAVFSVGDEPKDKLPNEETVEFFDGNNYNVQATNLVYGIGTYFEKQSVTVTSASKSRLLDTFSKLRKTTVLRPVTDKYNGDKEFTLL